MKVTSERIEGCQVELTIEVEPEEMEKALDKAYRRMVNKVLVPGFRKGKAPRDMLERHVGHESLVSEALDRLVPELYDQAIEQENVDAIAQPDLEMIEVEPAKFKATVPVRPVVELGDYRSISVTPDAVEITEDQVAEALENLRHGQATWEPVEREANFDDMVSLDIFGTVDGETVLDRKGGSLRLTAGAPVPVTGFSEQVVGMKAGDEKEFTLPFPDDYRASELAGKDCQFKVAVTEVKQENLSDMDDEFVKSLNEEGLETMDQLTAKIRENLLLAAERDAQGKTEAEAIRAAIEISKLEFPDFFIDQELDRMINEQLTRMGGINLETYLGYRGLTEEDFRNELRPVAQQQIASSLLLNKVYESEGIEVTEADVDAEVEKIKERVAQEDSEQLEQMEQVLSWPQTRDSLRGELLTRKTIDCLVAIATGKDVSESEEVPSPEDTSADEEKEEQE